MERQVAQSPSEAEGGMKQNYFFLRGEDNRPVGVVAMRATEDAATYLDVAVSVCSVDDQWNRKCGVNKAVGRLDSTGRWDNVSVNRVCDLSTVLEELGQGGSVAFHCRMLGVYDNGENFRRYRDCVKFLLDPKPETSAA